MRVIAHRIKNPKEAKKAISSGVDFLEIDVSQRILISKFIIQHNVIIGKLGIGPLLESLFTRSTKDRLFLDIKFVNRDFSKKFNKFLKNIEKGKVKICGTDWRAISNICHLNNFEAFYTIKSIGAWQRLKKNLPLLKKPHGFSVQYNLVNRNLIREIRKITQNIQIWAWTVNSQKEFRRLEKLEVDGIITDNWQQFPR